MKVFDFELSDTSLRKRYDTLFESCPSALIQQSTYWAEAISELGPDQVILLLCNDGHDDIAALPLYLFKGPSGNVLTSVPQAGPMGGIFYKDALTRSEIEDVYHCLLSRAVEIGERHSCLSLTIITNPFTKDKELYERFLNPRFTFENFTQYIDVNDVVGPDGFKLADYNRRSNLSRNVKKSADFGFEVEVCKSNADFDAWYSIHVARHTSLKITPINKVLFQNLRRFLEPRQKSHLLLVKKNGKIASGCFYVYHRDILDVFLLSMNDEFIEFAPNFKNTEESLLWCSRTNRRIYNWQSSPNRESGVYRYKKQWGSIELPYYFLTKPFVSDKVLQDIGLDTIRRDFPWHYVVPYGVFSEGFEKRHFVKVTSR